MISNENLGGLMGAPVIGADDDRIGTVGQVFVDPTTGAPNWVTVHTGWFGRHETFVPLDEASWDREELRVPYEKALVKDAPRIATDEALSAEQESDLYRYYGLEAAHGGSDRGTDDRGETASDTVDDAPHDAKRDESSAAETLRLRKYQVTEEKDITVPVTHEEVRLEPDPSVQADAGSTDEGSDDGPKHRA